jgi:hypothetical protein
MVRAHKKWKRQSGGYALITGASSGIGRSCAELLAFWGEDLILVSRNKKELSLLAEELKNKYAITAQVFACDLSLAGSAEDLYARCHKSKYRVDTLINNAGRGLRALPQHEQELSDAVSLFHLNCASAMELATLFARDMTVRGFGRILNVASTASFQAMPYSALYGASKAFLLSFSEAMHVELKGRGVAVTAVCPGITDTNFFKYGKPRVPGWLYPLIAPERVACRGLRALARGRASVIPAFRHWLFAQVPRFVPRSWVLALMRRVETRRKGITGR